MTVDAESDSKPSSKEMAKPIFSAEDRRGIVSNFAKAFLSGKIKVHSWTPGLVAEMSTGKKTSREELFVKKLDFTKTIMLACGMNSEKQDQIDRAVDEIFISLLAWRGGGLLEGEFTTTDQEAKLKALEGRFDSLEKLMLALIEEVRMLSHVRGSNPP